MPETSKRPGGIFFRLIESVAVIAVIIASAKLAAMMTISGQLLSPVWLPAAVCLTAAIWLGPRALPSILLGTGFVGWVVARDAQTEQAAALLSIFGTSIGAALQAYTGRYLVRRFIDKEAEVDSAADVFLLRLRLNVHSFIFLSNLSCLYLFIFYSLRNLFIILACSMQVMMQISLIIFIDTILYCIPAFLVRVKTGEVVSNLNLVMLNARICFGHNFLFSSKKPF